MPISSRVLSAGVLLAVAAQLAGAGDALAKQLSSCGMKAVLSRVLANIRVEEDAAYEASIAGAVRFQRYREGSGVTTELGFDVEPVPEGFLVTKTGDAWFSVHGYEDVNPVGDPRTFLLAQGELAAGVFGFERRGERAVLLPSVDRLNAGIDAVNQVLGGSGSKRKVGLRFYAADGKLEGLEYLKRFSEAGELPVAQEQVHIMLHDIDYHATNIFLPPEHIAYLRKETAQALDLARFLRRTLPPTAASEKQIQAFISRQVTRLDTALGNLGRHVSDEDALANTFKIHFETKGSSIERALRMRLLEALRKERGADVLTNRLFNAYKEEGPPGALTLEFPDSSASAALKTQQWRRRVKIAAEIVHQGQKEAAVR